MIRTGILQQLQKRVDLSLSLTADTTLIATKQSSEPVTHLWSGLPLVLLLGLRRTDLLLVGPAEQAGQHSAFAIVQHLQHTNNLSTMCLDKQTKLTSIAHLFIYFSFEILSSKVILLY